MPLFALETADGVGTVLGIVVTAVAAMIVLFKKDRRADAAQAAAAWKAWGETQAKAREDEGRAYREQIAELEKQGRVDAREIGRLEDYERKHP